MPAASPLRVGLLLCVSGCAALALQIGWLREFRLVFGSSTGASAAVLAVFMGGLGLGNALLGRRVERSAQPLKMLGLLLLAIAVSSAASPWLLDALRGGYLRIGGQAVLGAASATLLRLLMATLVLGLPTFCMGGTLPAAARAVARDDDPARRSVGLLYGLNELGAVLGAAASSFFLLEAYGIRTTILIAAAADALCGLLAIAMAGRVTWPATSKHASGPAEPTIAAAALDEANGEEANSSRASRWWLYTLAGVLGFAFLLMEVVWYRMLAPLLGGSTYTFGLILTLVLAGMSVGGLGYALLFRALRPTWPALAITCALEAVALAVPLALGDRLAIFATLLTGLRSYGFAGTLVHWTLVASPVVLPTSIIAGLQFPLLVALVGRGATKVGSQLGNAFAWNTCGAIAGSLAGGFGLLPLLGATGAWRACVALLAVVSLLLTIRARPRALTAGLALLTAGSGIALAALAIGPTAVWRHGGVGAGRFAVANDSPNALHDQVNAVRRAQVWQADGVETGVGLMAFDGLAFYLNGKSDGNAVDDVATQVMLPLIGGLLHPQPRTALVIGLGTGQSAGWLAAVPEIEQIDVVELEPDIVRVARDCAATNRAVLDNPKVRLVFADAREYLLCAPAQFDLIISEPSNPFRAGIANLYTREFYAAVRARLQPGGLFLQWLQTYDIDARAVRTVMATLRSEFAHVELWQTRPGDTVFVCGNEPIPHDGEQLQARVAQAPYREALAFGWQVDDENGLLAHYVAGDRLVDEVLASEPTSPNTDDCNRLEYGLARTLGRGGLFSTSELRTAAARLDDDRPSGLQHPTAATSVGNQLDSRRLEERRILDSLAAGEPYPAGAALDADQQMRLTAAHHYYAGRYADAVSAWEAQTLPPADLAWELLLAHAYAELGRDEAKPLIAELREPLPNAAEVLSAVWSAARDQPGRATEHLIAAFDRYRELPWPAVFARRGLQLALALAHSHATRAERLHDALVEPLAVHLLDAERLATRHAVGSELSLDSRVADYLAFEPHVPWTRGFLAERAKTYAAAKQASAARAERDLAAFLRQADDERLFTPAGGGSSQLEDSTADKR